MVYTITFNPSLDYVMETEALAEGKTNRSKNEKIFFGGKGINVSYILSELGVPTTALGFTAGFVGDEIEKLLAEKNIKTDFVRLPSGCSRINVKLKNTLITEINAEGPKITESDVLKLYEKLGELHEGDYLVLAGSIPSSLSSNIYEEIMKKLADKKVNFVVDASGTLLTNVLKYKPFLIKPNKDELEEIFNKGILADGDVISSAEKLKEAGAKNVLVSLGKDGSVLIDEADIIYRQDAKCGTVVNTVGAGDSMVAGFIAGYIASGDYETALKYGNAAGSATAFSEALANKNEILALLN